MGASESSLLPDYDPRDHRDETDLQLNSTTYPNLGNYTLVEPTVDRLVDGSQEEHMQYSDAVCRRYALNPIFLQDQQSRREIRLSETGLSAREDYMKSIEEGKLGATGIGNIAFVAHHNPTGFWADDYRALVDALQGNTAVISP